MRIVDYPFVVVRVVCSACGRKNAYRLARLAEAFGAELPLEELRARVTVGCPAWTQTGKRRRILSGKDCGARFPDLDQPLPPDLPPGLMALQVVGGKDAAE